MTIFILKEEISMMKSQHNYENKYCNDVYRCINKIFFQIYTENSFLGYKYRCIYCGRCYKVKGSLARHLKFECFTERQFNCDVCQEKFARKSTIKRHYFTVHKLDYSF